jgi:hypothetical protein
MRTHGRHPALTLEQILAWADAHHARTGSWPHVGSGPIPEAPGETWQGVESALRYGLRGMPGYDTLARLLRRHGRDRQAPPSGLRAWTPGEDDLVRALPPAEVARRTGRSLLEVRVRRYEMCLPDALRG